MVGMQRIIFAAVLCGLTACDDGTPEPRRAADAGDTVPSESTSTTPTASRAAPSPAAERKVIRRAELEVRTEAVAEVASTLGALAERFGGYVERSDGAAADDGLRRFEATLRVPAERFESTMSALRDVGEVVREKVDTTDVTAQVSDIEAHLRSHETLESRLLGLLTATESVEDALRVEEELLRVRSLIEALEGRRRTMARQVAMSTVDVVLTHPDPARAQSVASAGDKLGRAVADARALSVSVLAALIRMFGALVPLLFIGGPIAYATHRGLARRQRRSNRPTA